MNIDYVKKNSGYIQKFNLKKLERSIAHALHHADMEYKKLSERLAHETLEHLEGYGKKIVYADTIRNSVLHVMKQDKLDHAAESYELVSLHLSSKKVHEVVKRGGGTEKFHPHKLFKSIKKSFTHAGVDGAKMAETVTKKAITEIEKQYNGKSVPSEAIKKITAAILKNDGFDKAERMYILHKYL